MESACEATVIEVIGWRVMHYRLDHGSDPREIELEKDLLEAFRRFKLAFIRYQEFHTGRHTVPSSEIAEIMSANVLYWDAEKTIRLVPKPN